MEIIKNLLQIFKCQNVSSLVSSVCVSSSFDSIEFFFCLFDCYIYIHKRPINFRKKIMIEKHYCDII